MERLTEIVIAKIVKGLTSQVMGPEREQIDYEVFPVVLPMGQESVIGMAVCLFSPAPPNHGGPTDRIIQRQVLEDPYARQEVVDRLIMLLVEDLRKEYEQLRLGG